MLKLVTLTMIMPNMILLLLNTASGDDDGVGDDVGDGVVDDDAGDDHE